MPLTVDAALGLAAFAAVSSLTPGPNNLMLMASALNFGAGRSVPHMLGVAVGFLVMVALVGAGVAPALASFPRLTLALQAVCLAFVAWIVWRILHAAAPEAGPRNGARPLTFMQAAAFQWVNPKAWAMALTAVTVYAPDRATAGVLVVAAVFGVVTLPAMTLWMFAGARLRRLLADRRRLRVLNAAMAGLLVASIVPMLA
jgi:threonine/homoserine/homoserine lactone efflux protein